MKQANYNQQQMKKRQSLGFTIIELFVAVVILCILAALIALTASGVQAKNRNGDRQAKIDELRSQLESHYAQTNTYPTLANLNDADWRAKNLPRLKDSSLKDPRWSKKTTGCNPGGNVSLAEQPAPNCFSYQVTTSDGAACDNAANPCAHYTLTANLEGGEKYVKSSLN